MVSPVELAELGFKDRFRKLRWLLILSLLSILAAGFEVYRYIEYERCIVAVAPSVDFGALEKELDRLNVEATRQLGEATRLNNEATHIYDETRDDPKQLSNEKLKRVLGLQEENHNIEGEVQKLKEGRRLLEIKINALLREREARNACRTRYQYDVFRLFSSLSPIDVANAQTPPSKDETESDKEIRRIGILVIFGCMAAFFFTAAGAILFSKDEKVVAFGMDSLKTLLGFFIGVATSFLGLKP